MPVTEQTTSNTSTTNGVTTVFPYGFKIAQSSDIQVLLDNVPVTTGFTVSGVGNDSGGDVTFAVPPAAGKRLVRKRNMKYARSTDYQENGDLLSQTLDDDQDAPVMMIQQLAEQVSRAFIVPPGLPSPVFPPLLDPLKYWRNRADGLGVEFVDLSSGDSSIALAAALADPSDTKGATLVAFGPDTVAASLAASCRMFSTVAALRTNGNARITAAGTWGYYASGDGGDAPYYKDAADTTTADDGFLCIVDAGGRRWKLNRQKGVVNIRQAGAKGDGATDDTSPVQKCATAVGYGGTIIIPSGMYFLTATVTLRGAQKLRGEGVEASIFYRTGNYGDTFVCGTTDTSEPARSFEAHNIRFQHSTPYISGSSTLPDKATTGAHIRLRGAQGAVIRNCWMWRLPYQVYCEGGSWVTIEGSQFQGVYDQQTAATQETIAHLAAAYSVVHGNPTTWVVKGNNFLGATFSRNITYTATPSNKVVNRIDTIGPLYGFLIDGLEDLDLSGNYFGGQSAAELAFINSAGGSIIDIRVAKNFFDGIAQGQGVLFAPTVAGTASLGVVIADNIFTDNYHAIYANLNPTGNTPSVYKLAVRGNICLSGSGSQILLSGAKGFVASGNEVSDYNKYDVSSSDLNYIYAIRAFGVSAHGTITDNEIGGGGNTLVNDTANNFCYGGVLVDSTLDSVRSYNNGYTGLRSGTNFRTGRAVTESQVVITTGSYQVRSNDEIVIVNKTVGAATPMALPLYPVTGREVIYKDGKGDAATNNITATTNDGTTIDGAATSVINTNYGVRRFRFNGTQWNVI